MGIGCNWFALLNDLPVLRCGLGYTSIIIVEGGSLALALCLVLWVGLIVLLYWLIVLPFIIALIPFMELFCRLSLFALWVL